MGNVRKMMQKILWGLLICGSMLFFIIGVLLDKNIVLTLSLVACWLIFMLLAFATTDVLWVRQVIKKMDGLLPLVYTDPDQFIQRLTELMKGVEVSHLIMTKDINLAVAHCQKGNYRIAADLLNKLDPLRLPLIQRGVYWANLSLTQFHLNQKKAACAILDDQRESLSYIEEFPETANLLAVLNIYRLLAQGDREQARKAMEQLQQKQSSAGIQRELTLLEKQFK